MLNYGKTYGEYNLNRWFASLIPSVRFSNCIGLQKVFWKFLTFQRWEKEEPPVTEQAD